MDDVVEVLKLVVELNQFYLMDKYDILVDQEYLRKGLMNDK
jgi:hypothetical protein